MPMPPSDDREFALIVQATGQSQQLIARFLNMLLTYRYGLDIISADSFAGAYAQVKKHGRRIRCAFVIEHKKIDSKNSIASLSLNGDILLFLVLPQQLIGDHQTLLHRIDNIHYCPWESAFKGGDAGVQDIVGRIFAQRDIGDLYHAVQKLPFEVAQQKIENRLKYLKTLPTLPEVALKIMNMVEDPQTSVEDLDEVVTSDPAIVHKLLQVVNSPIFAGVGHKGDWPLQEALVRIGRKKVAAIAQQVKLMNNLVKPQESQFNLERYWTHSVGCALIADRLYKNKMVEFQQSIPFNDYWIGSLLHDIGKLVLGFFFWSHFEEVLQTMHRLRCSFRAAEIELGDVANHEYLGKLLLMKSKVDKGLVDAVATHAVPENPSDLVCLVHLANNLSKELAMGYLPDEQPHYDPRVLEKLNLSEDDCHGIRDALFADGAKEIKDVVQRCIGD